MKIFDLIVPQLLGKTIKFNKYCEKFSDFADVNKKIVKIKEHKSYYDNTWNLTLIFDDKSELYFDDHTEFEILD